MTTLKEAKDKVVQLSLKALQVTEDAELTPAEIKKRLDPLEADIKAAIEEKNDLEYVANKRKSFAANSGAGTLDEAGSAERAQAVAKSFGQQFIDSDQYKKLFDGGAAKSGSWTSGDIELKAPFTEGTAAAPGDGYAAATLTPNVLPGIVDQKFKPLTIADLFPSGGTDSSLIRYLVETMVTNGAGTVGEGQLPTESRLKFAKVDEVLHKIVTFLATTEEMLQDWKQARSFIDARLELFIRIAEEAQLLTGDGVGENMVGLLNRPGLATTIVKGAAPSTVDDNSMDAIYRQITAIRVTQFIEPDAIAIDPLGWQNITLAKNAQGAYYANGPFMDQANPSLWGKRVANSPAIPALSALVGAFAQGGQIFRGAGVTIEASNAHADFFLRGQTAVRASERIALAIYRPGAFGRVTGL